MRYLTGLADPAINRADNSAMMVNDITGVRLEVPGKEAVEILVLRRIFSLGDGHIDTEMAYKYADQTVLYQRPFDPCQPTNTF